MKSTFKTLFYLKKNEPKKNGHVVIMVRITVDGDQVQFSSKLDIHPDNWDTKAGRAVINKQSADKKENLRVSSLNKTLDEIRSAITMHYTRMMNVDGYALPEKIRNAFLGLEEKEKTLISYFTQHNEQYAKKVGKTATQKTYSRYELTKQQGFYDKNPGTDIAVKALSDKKPTINSLGLRLGNFVQIRNIIDEELEAVWAGKKTAKQALDAAVERGNAELARFAKANKK